MRRLSLGTFALLLFALLLAAPSFGQPIIKAGTDPWQTGAGTVYDFSADPLPAGFFCAGSAPFTGTIQFAGVPLVTDPAGILGNTDTLVERLADADLTTGSDSVPIVVRAMSLRGVNTITVNCSDGPQTFVVRACTCGDQPITKLEISLINDGCGCGKFSGDLALNTCISFENTATGAVHGPVHRPVILQVVDTPWCEKGGAGSLEVAEAYHVGTDCRFGDCYDESLLAVPATSNFFPGWTCAALSSGATCLDIFGFLTTCHSSFGQADHDHCINPVCCPREGQSCK